MKHRMLYVGTAWLAMAALATGASAQAGPRTRGSPTPPSKSLPRQGPGEAGTSTARAIQRTATEDKLVKKNIIVSNKPGGGGAVGWTYLKGKEGNANFLAVNSSLVLLNNLLGSSPLTYKDFTPLAMLTTEWISVAVKADSPYKSGKDLLEALRKDPGALTIGVGPSLGNNDHLSFIRIAQKFGVDVSKLKWVVFEGAGGDVVMNLLGGHVGLVTTALSETLTQHKAGKIRILGITADKRLDTLPDVATWKEQGVDMVFPHWRGIMGPPGTDAGADQVLGWRTGPGGSEGQLQEDHREPQWSGLLQGLRRVQDVPRGTERVPRAADRTARPEEEVGVRLDAPPVRSSVRVRPWRLLPPARHR